MGRVTYVEFDGTPHTVELDEGASLMSGARVLWTTSPLPEVTSVPPREEVRAAGVGGT